MEILERSLIEAREGCLIAFNATTRLCLAEHVALADTFLTRLVGLLGQPPAWTQNTGALWIVPSRGVHTMGMRFAIEAVFLDRRTRVIHLQENLRPWRISRVIRDARSVLELPPGAIARSGTRRGDEVAFELG